MTEAEFESKYRATLLVIEETVESAIDNDDADLDFETVNDILTLEFEDASAIIITKQGATQQLWMAAKSGGFHFAYNEVSRQWCSTIDQQTLAEKLALACREQGDLEIVFAGI